MDDRVYNFPNGLRVLVVDNNPICLKIIQRLLKNCKYEVTATTETTTCLQMLMENKDKFDILISDVHMPKMDGFDLLQQVADLELDIPVVMMSAIDDPELVMKGVKYGVADYLLKPIRTKELKNIWQHVVRKKQMKKKLGKLAFNTAARNDLTNLNVSNKKKDQIKTTLEDEDNEQGPPKAIDNIHPISQKKSRFVWSPQLHKKFALIVDQLGPNKAYPKRILEMMNVKGLTRECVASHLQKYRLYVKRNNARTNESTNTTSIPFEIPDSIYLNGRFSNLCSLKPGAVGRSSFGMSSTTPYQTTFGGMLGQFSTSACQYLGTSQPTGNVGKSFLQNQSLSSYRPLGKSNNNYNNNINKSVISALPNSVQQNEESFGNQTAVVGPLEDVSSQVVAPLPYYERYFKSWKSSTIGPLPTQEKQLSNINQLSSSNFNNNSYSTIDVSHIQNSFGCTFTNESVKEGQGQDSMSVQNFSYNMTKPQGWKEGMKNDITNNIGSFDNYLITPAISSSSNQIIRKDVTNQIGQVCNGTSDLVQNIEETDVDMMIALEHNNYFLEDFEILNGFTQAEGYESLDNIMGEIPK